MPSPLSARVFAAAVPLTLAAAVPLTLAAAPKLQNPAGLAAFRACEAAGQASDWEMAVVQCGEALVAFPGNFGIHYFLGFAHQARQEWERAALAFEAFVSAADAEVREDGGEPEDDRGQARLRDEVALAVRSAGIARLRAGDYGTALPLLARAAESDPTDPEVTFFLGVAQLELGQDDEAIGSFSAVVETAPHIAAALYFLGRLRYQVGDYAEAVIRLEQYLAADPQGPFRGEAHWRAGSIALRSLGAEGEGAQAPAERAAHHFSAFLETESDGARAATANYFLATIAEEVGNCAEARRHYERFLELAPDHERAAEVAAYLAHEDTRCLGPSTP